jgi:hypothetical protein
MSKPYVEFTEGSPPFRVPCEYWNRGVFQLSDLSNMSAGACQFKLSNGSGLGQRGRSVDPSQTQLPSSISLRS